MKKFEYKVGLLPKSVASTWTQAEATLNEYEENLNKMGEAGWDLIQVLDMKAERMFFFKREIQ
jgi:hypothetical protein